MRVYTNWRAEFPESYSGSLEAVYGDLSESSGHQFWTK